MLTVALTALTGTVSVAGLISPAVLGTLERTPAALHGEAWRWVAACGLAGLAAWSLRHERMPGWAGPAVALWLGALLATWWSPLFAVGVLGAALDRAFARTRPTVRTAAAVVASGVVAAVLIAAGNVHGPALAVGTLAGAVAARFRLPNKPGPDRVLVALAAGSSAHESR